MNICRNLLTIKKLSTVSRFPGRLSARFDRFFCSTMSTTNSFDMVKEKTKFFDSLPRIIENLANHPKFEELPIAREWMHKVLTGTVTGGKVARGLSTVMAYKIIEKPENITEETIRLAHTLGWCIELAYCTVLDDIVDGSSIRRGMPCWYRREDVGIENAVNDAILIYYCLNQILKDNFEKSPIYVKLFEAFNETLFYTSIGQFLDIRGAQNKRNYDLFTRENYEAIIKHKSSYYTYRLPISLGLMLANYNSEDSLQNCEQISFQLGKLFQIQDDYIDCFGDELLTGKVGSDIQEGKCTWLAVNALLRCNTKHRTVFSSCYGSKEPAHVERVKQLYVELRIPQLYKQEEHEIYENIIQKIETIPSVAERKLYQELLNITYERNK